MSDVTPDPAFMHRCLSLASLGRGRVGNGALVGAVLVRDDRIIAEGFHATYGGPHAERVLLESFTGEVLSEDVLYVNLEPCCHQGKTPPCTNLLIDRGVKTVIFGMLDPDPRVMGKGVRLLEKNGVRVIGNFERALCEKMNKGFIQVRRFGRPYLTLKKAITHDGKFAHDDGSKMKITSPQQNAWSHQFLRATHDAILVGVGTILTDNPQLNRRLDQKKETPLIEGLNRDIESEKNTINPYRIVLDPELRIPLSATVVSDTEASRTILCVTPEGIVNAAHKMSALRERGVMICGVAHDGDHFDWQQLWDVLIKPRYGYHGITSILVEGGAKTWETFKQANSIDEEVTLTSQINSAQ